jgi:hypothetical protein
MQTMPLLDEDDASRFGELISVQAERKTWCKAVDGVVKGRERRGGRALKSSPDHSLAAERLRSAQVGVAAFLCMMYACLMAVSTSDAHVSGRRPGRKFVM